MESPKSDFVISTFLFALSLALSTFLLPCYPIHYLIRATLPNPIDSVSATSSRLSVSGHIKGKSQRNRPDAR